MYQNNSFFHTKSSSKSMRTSWTNVLRGLNNMLRLRMTLTKKIWTARLSRQSTTLPSAKKSSLRKNWPWSGLWVCLSSCWSSVAQTSTTRTSQTFVWLWSSRPSNRMKTERTSCLQLNRLDSSVCLTVIYSAAGQSSSKRSLQMCLRTTQKTSI